MSTDKPKRRLRGSIVESTPRFESELHEIIRKARKLAPPTRMNYLRSVDEWIGFAGADPSAWVPLRLQAFYEHLLDERGLRAQSANLRLAGIRYASKWRALYAGRPELDFARVVQTERAYDFIEGRKRALAPDDAARLLASLRGSDPLALRDFAIVVTLLETGMRNASLTSMSIEQTLLTPERVAATRAPFPLSMVHMKGHGPATTRVPLSDCACAAIAPWVHWLNEHGVTQGPLLRGIDEKISPQGKRVYVVAKTGLTRDSVNKMLTRRAEIAGIEHVYPHRFRYTLITWRALAGYQLHEIAALTGHVLRGADVMQGYLDDTKLAEKMRNTTPEWLAALVRGES